MKDILAKEEEKLKKAVISSILPSLINDLHKLGIISDADLSDNQIVNKKIFKFLNRKNKSLIDIVWDHRSSILSLADLQTKEGYRELAMSLYATYVEHSLNHIIHLQCLKKKFDEKTKLEILRSVNLNGKCNWLLKVLGLPILKPDHVKTILAMADERNSFFHYKCKPDLDSEKIPDPEKDEIIFKEEINRVKALLKYLKNYETRLKFDGKKKKIIKVSLKRQPTVGLKQVRRT